MSLPALSHTHRGAGPLASPPIDPRWNEVHNHKFFFTQKDGKPLNSREGAVTLLNGHPPGTYLLRNSSKGGNYFTLSVVHETDGFRHFQMEIKPDWGYAVPDFVHGGYRLYESSIEDVLDNLKRADRIKEGLIR